MHLEVVKTFSIILTVGRLSKSSGLRAFVEAVETAYVNRVLKQKSWVAFLIHNGSMNGAPIALFVNNSGWTSATARRSACANWLAP
ncbi:hypothetical protein, partial [Massilia sp.]|uniref:hypothetical protein n=1 Tax=Massilia sp. TaxID=1882437 RepID=UPI0028A6BE26